jgi:hypothetical protein
MGKYCPLSWLSPKKFTNEECETKECAWWDNKREQCSIKTFLTNREEPAYTTTIPKGEAINSVVIKQEPSDINHYFL